MNAARQVIRWAIPGWLLMIFLLLFCGAEFIVRDVEEVLSDQAFVSLFAGLSKTSTSTMLLLAGGAIPLGYFIYQFYYWHMWRGFPWGRLRPFDRGAWVLRDLNIPYRQFFAGPKGDKDEDGIPDGPMEYKEERPRRWLIEAREALRTRLRKPEHRSRPRHLIFTMLDPGTWLDLMAFAFRTSLEMSDYMKHWHLEESVWYALVHRTKAGLLESRAEHLADIYHSLGAASASALFAYVAYIGYLVFFRAVLSWPLYVTSGASCNMDASALRRCLVASTGLLLIIFHLLRSCRSTTKWNLLVLKRHFIVRYFR